MKGIVLLAALHILIIYQAQKKKLGKKAVVPKPAPAAAATGEKTPTLFFIFSLSQGRTAKDLHWYN
ncbi:MAG: hypothetical protein ABJC12_13365 [Saprospiraceae bacterium]